MYKTMLHDDNNFYYYVMWVQVQTWKTTIARGTS